MASLDHEAHMHTGHSLSIPPLQPEEVAGLRAIIDEWCHEYGCNITGKLAQDRAKKLLLAYSAGVRDAEALRNLIRPF